MLSLKNHLATLAGALCLAGATLAVAPAQAAPIGTAAMPLQAQASDGLVEQAQYYGPGPRRHYRRGPPPRHYGRPVYRPRCYFVDRRVWNGYRWVIRPVRVCR